MAGSGVFPKTSTVDVIYQGDYNTIQSVTAGVLGTFYGQSLVSSQVSGNPVITAAQWDLLRQDINKAYRHITNANSSINDVNVQDLILAGDANAYKTAADYCEANKTTAHPSQLTTTVVSTSLTTPWNGLRTWTYRATWADANSADYWFNLGGYFVVDVSGSNADPASPKDVDWQDNILNAIPSLSYTRTNWVAGLGIGVFEYGNVGVYGENYCQITMTKINSTTLDISVILNEADAGDQTGIGPAVDEDVNTDAAASITVYSSFDAIVAPAFNFVPTSNW